MKELQSRHQSLFSQQSLDRVAATDQSWIVLTKDLVEIRRIESVGGLREQHAVIFYEL